MSVMSISFLALFIVQVNICDIRSTAFSKKFPSTAMHTTLRVTK